MADNSEYDSVPYYLELMNPTISAIRSHGGSASNHEIVGRVISDMGLPSRISEQPHGKGGMTELEYRLYWARTYLKRYGLIENSTRGVWSLTSKGHDVDNVDPQDVYRFVRSLIVAEKKKSDREDSQGNEDGLAKDAEEETAVWRENLLELLLELPFDAFERLCQRLLRESGFIEVEVTGKSGDGGIDGQGIIRLAGLISFPVMFQCKRYRGSVSASAVRDFRGAMQGRADKGVILTTGGFTRDAYKEATRDGAPPIDLIDGALLVDRLKELNLGVETRMVEEVEINSEWFRSI